jgi:hypothetical protein
MFWSCCLLACGGQTSSGAGRAASGGAGTGGGFDADEVDAPPTVPASGQRILFEVSYVTFAIFARVNGFFVQVDGGVYAYDYFDGQPDASSSELQTILTLQEQMSEAEVTRRYGTNPSLISTVAGEELLAMYSLLGAARTGALLTHVPMADAGVTKYLGWAYDSSTATYRYVVLGSGGDVQMRNTTAQAETLVAWLAGLTGYSRTDEYEAASVCLGASCNSAPPSCRANFTATVDGGCWSDCVSTASCQEVSSCAVCAPDLSCVIAPSGGRHCSVLRCADATSEPNCDCFGDVSPCAGGKSWCRGSKADGFYCEPP